MPADRLKAGIQFQKEELVGLRNAFFSLTSRYAMKQERLDSNERRTPEYFLLDAGIGGNANIAGASVSLALNVENLFDRSYFDHLSRYKNFALNPGRNIVFKCSVPFGILK